MAKTTQIGRKTVFSIWEGGGQSMNAEKDTRLSFFDYMELAKQELLSLQAMHPELKKLSAREIEVFAQLLTDKTQDQIAKELFISNSSVHFHCKNIYKKLEVSSRRQILVKYKNLLSGATTTSR